MKLQKLLCFLFGHKFHTTFAYYNGRSHYGTLKCTRCGYTEDWQYDL